MKKIFTPELKKNIQSENEKVVAPSEQTITFLRLFARSYYVEQSLPEGLKVIGIN